jgi:hypothetical protein
MPRVTLVSNSALLRYVNALLYPPSAQSANARRGGRRRRSAQRQRAMSDRRYPQDRCGYAQGQMRKEEAPYHRGPEPDANIQAGHEQQTPAPGRLAHRSPPVVYISRPPLPPRPPARWRRASPDCITVRGLLHADRDPLLGWIHNHIGHLTPLIYGLVPGRTGLIIGDAAHHHGGRRDCHCTERGSRYRRTNDHASDSPGRIGSAVMIIPSITVTMVIICPVLPVFLHFLGCTLAAFLPLLA